MSKQKFTQSSNLRWCPSAVAQAAGIKLSHFFFNQADLSVQRPGVTHCAAFLPFLPVLPLLPFLPFLVTFCELSSGLGSVGSGGVRCSGFGRPTAFSTELSGIHTQSWTH